MKFIDEVFITVRSGDGGRGCVSFRREKFVPRGGPNGGDGGKGGDIILQSSSRRRTLYPFRFRRQFQAKNGGHGRGKQQTGRNGENLIIEIPPGTLVSNAETNNLLKDFTQVDESFIVAKGGRGGQGNSRFKTSIQRAPRYAQPGEAGQFFKLKLELKLLADVGIIGLPNAGKSTLISALSSATPKIADYPFTTLTPILGVVEPDQEEPFVVADIPGLIEGAHKGAGLGTRFLRHIERTRFLVHLIDAASIDPQAPLTSYETINRELAQYNPQLIEKPQILVLNKMDIPGTEESAAVFKKSVKDRPVMMISAAARRGIDELKFKLAELLDNAEPDPPKIEN